MKTGWLAGVMAAFLMSGANFAEVDPDPGTNMHRAALLFAAHQRKTVLLSGHRGLTVQFAGAHRRKAALPGDRSMYNLIRRAEGEVEGGNWNKAAETVHQLDEQVRKRYWMLQLLGDEEEYETLQRDLAQLQSAVRMRSRTEALLLLADIRSILDHIFSL